MNRKKKAALVVAAAIGVSAAAALDLWDGAQEQAAGRPDPDKLVEQEHDQYLSAVVDVGPDGGGPRLVELKARRQHIRAGVEVKVPGLGRGLIVRVCGAVKDRPKLCPDLYPPEKLCACCDWPRGKDCPGAHLCRFGKWVAGGAPCDPLVATCRPWACELSSGDSPEVVAEESMDAGGGGG